MYPECEEIMRLAPDYLKEESYPCIQNVKKS